MKKIKLYLQIIIAIFTVTLWSSCLKRDLKDYPLFDSSDITLVNAEYRFKGSQMMNGQAIVEVQKLNVSQVIDKSASTIAVTITVPAIGSSFTAEERAKVSQNNLWFYFNISTAASIAPIGDTPMLGSPTDATKPLKYRVTAANGDAKDWTINIIEFNK